jgi:hypothetical protein
LLCADEDCCKACELVAPLMGPMDMGLRIIEG